MHTIKTLPILNGSLRIHMFIAARYIFHFVLQLKRNKHSLVFNQIRVAMFVELWKCLRMSIALTLCQCLKYKYN